MVVVPARIDLRKPFAVRCCIATGAVSRAVAIEILRVRVKATGESIGVGAVWNTMAEQGAENLFARTNTARLVEEAVLCHFIDTTCIFLEIAADGKRVWFAVLTRASRA